MIIWSAFITPFIITLGFWYFCRQKYVWWEIILGIAASTAISLLTAVIIKAVALDDTQYKVQAVTEARYYEYWETWVNKTCTRTVSNGKTTTTVSYDCSYCDRNQPTWYIVTEDSTEHLVYEDTYSRLKEQWKAVPRFVDQNRKIKTRRNCGKDGDMYSIEWDKRLMTTETYTSTSSYKNPLLQNKSAFNYEYIGNKEAEQSGLYRYPKLRCERRWQDQDHLLGKELVTQPDTIIKLATALNSKLFTTYNSKVFILLFPEEMHIEKAKEQEVYWKGGNENEIVICIGVTQRLEVKWVHTFSWSKNQTLDEQINSIILGSHNLNDIEGLYDQIADAIEQNWEKPIFKEDFDYIKFEFKWWQKLIVYILSIAVCVGVSVWNVTNEYGGYNPPQRNPYRW